MILKQTDPEMYEHLESLGVNPQFYSLRWIMLLLCQEFDMFQVIRLWDSLLSDPERFQYLNYVCVAIVQFNREGILEDDFACCMESLQASAKGI
jgi:hypothetical protein